MLVALSLFGDGVLRRPAAGLLSLSGFDPETVSELDQRLSDVDAVVANAKRAVDEMRAATQKLQKKWRTRVIPCVENGTARRRAGG